MDGTTTLINLLEPSATETTIRDAQATSSSGVNCDLFWNIPFETTNYSFTVNGFDGRGNPVMIYLISKSTTKIVIKTLANATITAIAIPHG
jgi:hypothetical protein